ncbi:7073_t:CDS:2 [Diversispora eburnea]|uniref:7073_t:CDS:1 n=1 Tax=Diversispora eburnea TaxID=1213867 RepID=A0A9N8UZB8_9GLOM|nr:7073_t:CDS:2 [Diversispora eburnea]
MHIASSGTSWDVPGCDKGTIEFRTIMNNITPKISEISRFILNNFNELRKIPNLISKPLIIGINGPQGCGKTTLVGKVSKYLKDTNNLSVLNCSIDDFYLTHKDQIKLSQKYLGNLLLEYRGEPGTHDISLGTRTLKNLCIAHENFYKKLELGINSNEPNEVLIPVYDKSLNNGRGDRTEKENWIKVKSSFNIILFEGWLLGFKHLCKDQLELVYHSFIHIDTEDINYVYQWRLEQERKIGLGKVGMTDEQVYDFVESIMEDI